MNVLITGSAGFIGSHAADWFTHNYGVVALDSFTYAAKESNTAEFCKSAITGYKIDITQQEDIENICREHNIEWIVNFAAETHVDRSIKDCDNFIWSNIIGTKSLLEACKNTGVKICHVSTDEVYGDISSGSFSEEDKLNPKNPYAATKAAAEHMVRAYHNTYGVEHIIVRPSNNFGPRQHIEKLLPKVITNCIEGHKIPIYGDGKQIREWTFVEETVQAIEFLVRNYSGVSNECYNISSEIEKRNIDIVSEVCDIMGKDFDSSVEFVEDRLGHDTRYSVSSAKLKSRGFKYEGSFKEDLEKTISYYA